MESDKTLHRMDRQTTTVATDADYPSPIQQWEWLESRPRWLENDSFERGWVTFRGQPYSAIREPLSDSVLFAYPHKSSRVWLAKNARDYTEKTFVKEER